MLLSAVFTNPHENATVWKSMILDALPGLGSMFLSLLSPSWQDLLIGKRNDKDISAIDWETYSQRFKIWARNLFVLFASAQRPLVIFIGEYRVKRVSRNGDLDMKHPNRRLAMDGIDGT